MLQVSSEARNKRELVRLDHIIGLRAWGLIVYGVLPANLALLGFIKIEIAGSINNSVPPSLIPSLIIASFLPILVTFSLIRSRHKEWYLTADYLNLRSAIVTLIITAGASLIFGASGVIHGRYIPTLSGNYYIGVGESLLFGVASLVLSSTLFITILTKGADLPGLPLSAIINPIATARGKLRQLQANSIWNHFDPTTGTESLKTAKKLAEEAKDALAGISAYPGHKLAKRSLEPVEAGLKYFISATGEILVPGAGDNLMKQRWEKYFDKVTNLNDDRKAERARIQTEYSAIQELKKLRLGGAND